MRAPPRKRDTTVRSSFGQRGIHWVIPTHGTLRKVFSNPTYAGVYTWGRTETRIDFRDGALSKSRARCKVPVEEARVFIRDHHPAYITWEQFEANRARTADNKPRWGVSDNRGAIRKGGALLAGLLRCGHCGRRTHVLYSGTPVYSCHGDSKDESRRDCLNVGAVRVDVAVSEQRTAMSSVGSGGDSGGHARRSIAGC